MKYTDATRQLKSRAPYRVYLISGEESYLADKFQKNLLQIINPGKNSDALQYFSADSDIKAVLQSLDSPPFFSDKNIVIAEDLKIFQDKLSDKDKRDEKLLADYIPTIPEYSILILRVRQKTDKRRKIIKLIEKYGLSAECEPLAHWNIGDWLSPRLRELNLRFDREAYACFTEAVKSMDKVSLGFLDQELIKLTLYADDKNITRPLLEKTLSSVPEISVFNLWDALCAKNIALALELFDIQQKSGARPLRLLSLLVRQVRQLWQVKEYLNERQNPRQIAAALKLHPFIAEKVIKQANNFTLEHIESTLIDLADADYKLKTGSDEPALIENILIRFCR